MEGDLQDRRLTRLFSDLRDADAVDAPPFGALIQAPSPVPVATRNCAILSPWALTSALLATAAAAVFLAVPCLVGPKSPHEPQPVTTGWSSPTDWLLGSGDSFGSLETTWQSPTDSLFDFGPANRNT
jgi:hypothetical protein